jgi:flagellar biosynthesis protein FlhF
VRLKTFRAFTLDEALDAVRSDLGVDAAILHTRTFRRGGFLGIGSQEIVEVIASELEPGTTILPAVTRGNPVETLERDVEKPEEDAEIAVSSPPITGPALAANRARQAYASVGASRPDAPLADDRPEEDPPPRSTSLEVDRDRTRALAKAMEIRLGRQQAAREAAGVLNPDDVIGDRSAGQAVDPVPVKIAERPIAERPTAERPTAERPTIDSPLSAVSSEPTSFIIGPGGVLVAEESASPEPAPHEVIPSEAPRVISLDPVDTRPAAETGLPVASMPTPAPAQSTIEIPASELASELAPELDQESAPAAKPTSAPTTEIPQDSNRRPEMELEAIGATVRRVLDGDPGTRGFDPGSESDDGPDPLTDAYAELIAQEFSRDLAGRVIASLESSLDDVERQDPRRVRRAMLAEIADLVPTEESIETVVPRDGRPRTIAFVGPTGVGKTTTLAKIAATLTLRDGLKVGMVTADTYRISAVDQLRTYADILEVPLEVAGDTESMREALARCQGLDAILIDTPGRSQNDTDSLAELRAIMDAARPHETHLVLSGTAAERVLMREAEAFAGLGPDRVVLTKLDEAVAFGMLVSVVRRIGRRISWVTTGQEVPSDVERATGTRLADLVLGGAVKS